MKLKIWDFGGAGFLPSPAVDSVLVNANVVIVCFDLTRRSTYDNAAKWVDAAKAALSNGAILFIVGTKADEKAAMFASARDFACTLVSLHSAAGYMFTSAKTGVGIEDAFRSVAAQIVAARKAPSSKQKDKCVIS